MSFRFQHATGTGQLGQVSPINGEEDDLRPLLFHYPREGFSGGWEDDPPRLAEALRECESVAKIRFAENQAWLVGG